LVGCQHEVAIDDHAYWEAGADRKRRLNVEIAADDPLADLVEALRSAASDCLDEIVLIAGGTGFGSDAEQVESSAALKSPAQ